MIKVSPINGVNRNKEITTIARAILDRESFQNSTRSFRGNPDYNLSSDHESYRILSYATCVAEYYYPTGEWWITEQKYSVTTSKHVNTIRAIVRELEKLKAGV